MSPDDHLTTTLGTALHTELADLHAAPGLAATVRRRHTRHTRLLQAAVTAPLIAAVTAFAISSTATTDPPGPTGDHVATAPPVHNVAYVTQHTDTALADLSHYVLKTTSSLPGHTAWTDPATGRTRTDITATDGTPQTASLRSGPLSQGPSVLTVDTTTRTWWTIQLPPVTDTTAGVEAFTDPHQIRAALRAGVLQLISDDHTGGQDTIHLQLTGRTQTDLPQIDLWVDATTYLPVRLVGTKDTQTSAINYTWLNRTPTTLAQTTLTVPPGYTHRANQPATPAQTQPAQTKPTD